MHHVAKVQWSGTHHQEVKGGRAHSHTKNGDQWQPWSYQTISLLSPTNISQGGMTETIWHGYKFTTTQLGFQKRMRAETAIHRRIHNVARLKYTAILDLKSAFGWVSREKLVKVLAKKLRKITVEMFRTMLQKMRIKTSGDILRTKVQWRGAYTMPHRLAQHCSPSIMICINTWQEKGWEKRNIKRIHLTGKWYSLLTKWSCKQKLLGNCNSSWTHQPHGKNTLEWYGAPKSPKQCSRRLLRRVR